MFRSPVISRKATTTKSSKEKWLSSVQSTREKGENEIGGPSTVTRARMAWNDMLLKGVVYGEVERSDC